VGVIVDRVEDVLDVEGEQIEPAPGADPTVIDSIVKIGEHLVVLINPGAIFAGPDRAGD
jgi:chemotaxis signal transduction protein